MKAIAKRLRRLEEQLAPADGKLRVCLRLIVGPVGGIYDLEGATCHRTLCANGTVMELVIAGNAGPIQRTPGRDLNPVSNEELESFIQTFPVEAAQGRKTS